MLRDRDSKSLANRPRSKPINIQDSFLVGSLKEGRILAFALVTGKAIKGRIVRFDRYAVVVDDGARDLDLQARERGHYGGGVGQWPTLRT